MGNKIGSVFDVEHYNYLDESGYGQGDATGAGYGYGGKGNGLPNGHSALCHGHNIHLDGSWGRNYYGCGHALGAYKTECE